MGLLDVCTLDRAQLESLESLYYRIRDKKDAKMLLLLRDALNKKENAPLRTLIPEDVSPQVLSDFLKQCHEENVRRREEARRRVMMAVTEHFPDVAQAFAWLEHVNYFDDDFLFLPEGDTVRLFVDYGAFAIVLTLRGAQYDAAVEPYTVFWTDTDSFPADYDPESGRCTSRFWTSENEYTITFSGIECEFVSLNAAETSAAGRTFMKAVQTLTRSVVHKESLPVPLLNSEETALLPLIWELEKLSARWEGRELAFPLMKENFSARADKEAVQLLTKIEKHAAPRPNRKDHRALTKAYNALSREKYEDVWRALYDRIAATQKTYPSAFGAVYRKDELAREIRYIDAWMTENGYEGQYPEYRRRVRICGFHRVYGWGGKSTILLPREEVWRVLHVQANRQNEKGIVFEVTGGLCRGEPPHDLFACWFSAGALFDKLCRGGELLTRMLARANLALELRPLPEDVPPHDVPIRIRPSSPSECWRFVVWLMTGVFAFGILSWIMPPSAAAGITGALLAAILLVRFLYRRFRRAKRK